MLKRLFHLTKAFKSQYKSPGQSHTISSFSQLQVPEIISRYLEQFPNPSQIQAKSIKILTEGNDLVGIAPTGSGKTLAFAIPALIKAAKIRRQNSRPFISTIVVCPTRQLSNQIFNTINPLAKSLRLKVANLYGGASKYEQFDDAKMANIIVATPGRLADYSSSGTFNRLAKVQYVVLDEADQMLELNFEDHLNSIIEQTLPERQTVLFSATWDHDIELLAGNYLKSDAYYLQIGNNSMSINPNIEQHFRISSSDKIKQTIATLLNNHTESKVLIFCNSKVETRDLAFELNDLTQRPITYLTSDLTQEERASTMQKFRDSIGGVMVATDVVSRGIDIKDIELVINYGFPNENSDFIHRIGRTGRAGRTGKSLTFIFKGNPKIQKNLRYIRDLFLNQKLPIPASLADIIEQMGMKIYTTKQPVQKDVKDEKKKIINKKKKFSQSEEQSVQQKSSKKKPQLKKVSPAAVKKPIAKPKVVKKKRDSDENDSD